MDEISSAGVPLPVNAETLRQLTQTLQRYKAGKRSVERRAVEAENWWKLRNELQWEKEQGRGLSGFNAKSGWLHNVIVAKHADLMEAYPEPNILPREPGDAEEAAMLGKIIPVILEQNHFGEVYSDMIWQKLKTGTGICKIIWDPDKLGGLGDIAISKVDVLNLFWEPGIRDIQDSRYVFHTSLQDNDSLQQLWPQLQGRLGARSFQPTRFLYDDSVDVQDKSCVIDCYYKRREGARTVLHYCKYVGDTLLYSTENSGVCLYEHGLYPFVFDCLYPVEGSPAGYGYIDLCANSQEQIDIMQTAFLKNTMAGAVPRYFQRIDGSVNEEEFLDLDNPIVHVNGTLGEDALRPVQYTPLSGNYITMRQYTIDELRQTSGNTEAASGATPSGVTAASAIVALQEAAGKGSRDATRGSYRAYGRVVELCIELVRQFYTLPRQFRITGELGAERFVSYSNRGLGAQPLRAVDGREMLRLPVFDIRVEPAKRTAYSRVTQNELALQFYRLGFFAPGQGEQALAALQMMDFDDRDRVAQLIRESVGREQERDFCRRLALELTARYEPERLAELEALLAPPPEQGTVPGERPSRTAASGEGDRITRARARSRQASQIAG